MGVFDDDIASAKEDIAAEGELCNWYLPPEKAAAQKWKDAELDVDDPATQNVDFELAVLFFPVDANGFRTLQRLGITDVPKGVEQGLAGVDHLVSMKHICQRSDGRIYGVINVDLLDPNGEAILQTILFQRQ